MLSFASVVAFQVGLYSQVKVLMCIQAAKITETLSPPHWHTVLYQAWTRYATSNAILASVTCDSSGSSPDFPARLFARYDVFGRNVPSWTFLCCRPQWEGGSLRIEPHDNTSKIALHVHRSFAKIDSTTHSTSDFARYVYYSLGIFNTISHEKTRRPPYQLTPVHRKYKIRNPQSLSELAITERTRLGRLLSHHSSSSADQT